MKTSTILMLAGVTIVGLFLLGRKTPTPIAGTAVSLTPGINYPFSAKPGDNIVLTIPDGSRFYSLQSSNNTAVTSSYQDAANRIVMTAEGIGSSVITAAWKDANGVLMTGVIEISVG